MKQIKEYIQEEDAIDNLPATVLLMVIGIALATALGWWIWNTLQKRTESSSCANNPSPFCIE